MNYLKGKIIVRDFACLYLIFNHQPKTIIPKDERERKKNVISIKSMCIPGRKKRLSQSTLVTGRKAI